MSITNEILAGLTHGFILGSVYGLATIGLNLIFGVMRIVNVGHGAFIMIGAYIAYWLFILFGVIPVMSMFMALVMGIALGLVFFYTVIRRLIGAPELSSLLATFGIGILLEELARVIWGPDTVGYKWPLGSIQLPWTLISIPKIFALISSILIVVILYLLLYRTRLGAAIRAVVQDAEGSMICGVDVNRVFAYSFVIGITLTTISGVLLTLFIPVGINPYMGGVYTLKAFVIAVLGGLGSPWGAFIGGFIFGLLENGSYVAFSLIPGLNPFPMTRFLAFLVLLIILLIKPTGLFGG